MAYHTPWQHSLKEANGSASDNTTIIRDDTTIIRDDTTIIRDDTTI